MCKSGPTRATTAQLTRKKFAFLMLAVAWLADPEMTGKERRRKLRPPILTAISNPED